MATKFPKKKSSSLARGPKKKSSMAIQRGSKVRILKKSSKSIGGYGRIGRKRSSGARTKQTARKSGS
jgi:hypothetical protein